VCISAITPHAGGLPLETIFVGGGTPSLLGAAKWERLLGCLGDVFDLSLMTAKGGSRARSTDQDGENGRSADAVVEGEFTVECNPESATPELMAVLAAGGVNRVSVGAQSFDLRHLKTLERWHNPDNVFRAIEAARAAGIARQSLDLIYAVPGQTLDEWVNDVRLGLSAGTTHLSCYNLTYEPNTAMTARLKAGQFQPIDEELEIAMFEATHAELTARGLERYEVSNYAVPGHECRHNMGYWRQEQWLAAGPSASGHVYASGDRIEGGYRWKNTPRLGDYLAGDAGAAWYSPLADLEAPDPARAVRERIMTGVRLAEGIDRAETLADAERVLSGAAKRLEMRAKPYEERGLLEVRYGRWVLSEAAMLRADGIAGDLMKAVW